jgi:hypothetical protein
MRNGRVGLKSQLRTLFECPSNSPTVLPESHLHNAENLNKYITTLIENTYAKMIIVQACSYEEFSYNQV